MLLSFFVYVSDVYQIDEKNYYCQKRKLYFVFDKCFIRPDYEIVEISKNIASKFNEETYDKLIENMLKIYDSKHKSPSFYFYIDMEISEEELFYYKLQCYEQ